MRSHVSNASPRSMMDLSISTRRFSSIGRLFCRVVHSGEWEWTACVVRDGTRENASERNARRTKRTVRSKKKKTREAYHAVGQVRERLQRPVRRRQQPRGVLLPQPQPQLPRERDLVLGPGHVRRQTPRKRPRLPSQLVQRRAALGVEGPYERTSGWSSKASDGVERRRGRGLKARCGRRDAPAKVLKERRSPRRRGRMGTSVQQNAPRATRRPRTAPCPRSATASSVA